MSGYAKNPIMDWSEVDWSIVREELEVIMTLAKDLNLWVVLGSAHPLTPPHWPHNSLYIISDEGNIVNRYDKRKLSYNEATKYYSPGTVPVTFNVDGFRFGCIICVEINFPDLFAEYEQLGVDCLLLSAYPEAPIFYTKARSHAAINAFWVGLSVPAERSDMMASTLIDPNGDAVVSVETKEGVIVANMDPSDPEFDIALNKARPWRATARHNAFYREHYVDDPRSADHTSA
jgi:predicted amidohydrolase